MGHKSNGIQRSLTLGGAMLLCLLTSATVQAGLFSLADLRPESLKETGVTEALETKGRALLAGASHFHGMDKLEGHQTYELILEDRYADTFIMQWMKPWPDDHRWMRLQFAIDGPAARVAFLDGAPKGETWGYTGENTYRHTSRGIEVGTVPHMADRLPILKYLYEFPLRIQEAEIVAYAGPGTVNGAAYERVFATWGSAKPNRSYDQFLVWLDPKTLRIDYVEYTYREKGYFVVGHRQFKDYRRMHGILIPFYQISATQLGGQVPRHEFFLKEFRFDTVGKEQLEVVPADEQG